MMDIISVSVICLWFGARITNERKIDDKLFTDKSYCRHFFSTLFFIVIVTYVGISLVMQVIVHSSSFCSVNSQKFKLFINTLCIYWLCHLTTISDYLYMLQISFINVIFLSHLSYSHRYCYFICVYHIYLQWNWNRKHTIVIYLRLWSCVIIEPHK